MSVIVEGPRAILVAGPVSVVDEETEVAWEAAKAQMRVRSDFAWVRGRYLETGDKGNLNGHIFGLEDVQAAHDTVVHTALNIGHADQYCVGTYVASEVFFPSTTGPEAAAAAVGTEPWVETLAAMWRRRFPDEYADLKKAHGMGVSWQSMEAVPKSLTCRTEGGCGRTFPFDGIKSETYCAELNAPASRKKLNKPHFVGGALVLPPLKPGWPRADVTELASLIRHQAEQAEQVYTAVSRHAPHLEPEEWEELMVALLAVAYGVTA